MPKPRLLGGNSVASFPAMRIRPEVGWVVPAMRFRIVVLPDPLGPSSVTNSPFRITKSTFASADTIPYCLETCLTSTIGGAESTRSLTGISIVTTTTLPLAERAHDDASRIVARNTRDAAAGMCRCTAQIESPDRGLVVRIVCDGAPEEDLVGAQLAMMHMPPREVEDPFEI